MTIEITKQTKDMAHLTIKGELTIYTVAIDKPLLLNCFKSTKEINIDLSGVNEMDSAGLQLLMHCKNESLHRNVRLTLAQHSKVVIDVFELLNLNSFFGDPLIIPSGWS